MDLNYSQNSRQILDGTGSNAEASETTAAIVHTDVQTETSECADDSVQAVETVAEQIDVTIPVAEETALSDKNAETVKETEQAASDVEKNVSLRETVSDLIGKIRSIKLSEKQLRGIATSAIILLLTFVTFFAAWLLPSSAQMNLGSQYSGAADINSAAESGVANIAARSLHDIYELPEVYILPVSCEPAPEPNENNFTVELNSKKRVECGTYTDATISVTVWKENRDNTVYNFAEVKINHPTQFRTMFASGEYSTASRGETPLNMAKQSNAVVAMSSDFCRYNQNGTLIIRGGNFYKHTPSGWEVLLVDDNGDFHFAIDNEVELTTTSRGVEWNGKVIYNSFSFGPVLVRDGKAITDFNDVKAAIHGIYLTGDVIVARAAIGQLGELHYLLCTVDGNRGETFGVTLPQLAVALEEKGCINAYNLDGGHSATLVFNDTLVNIPAAKDDSGAQRIQSDIIYFGTAIPNEEE